MVKSILDEIAAEGGSNAKMDILRKYTDNETLKEVLYKACSKRIKFYIKQIPEYTNLDLTPERGGYTLEQILVKIEAFSNKEITGNAGIEYLKKLLQNTTENNAYILERIIGKDLKIGMGTSNINKVFPKLIEKTPYMGAKSFSEKLAKAIFEKAKLIIESISNKPIAVSQVKMDGRYCNAIIDNRETDLVSRQGETTFVGDADFLKELSLIEDNVVINGELTVDGLDRYTANGIVASIVDIEGKRESRGEKATEKKIVAFEKKHGSYSEAISKIRFTVWDIIDLDEYHEKKSSTPYHERLDRLTNLINSLDCKMVSLVETEYVTSYKEAMKHFQDSLERGLEGTILKSLDDGWKDGKPNWQVKMKLEMNLDLKIVGFNYGTKGTKNENVISTLQVESSCGQLKTNPSGMKEDMMKFVTENQDNLLGTVVEIRCCGLSQDKEGNWSTLHPSVVKLRDDKDTFDSLESAKQVEEMVKTLI